MIASRRSLAAFCSMILLNPSFANAGIVSRASAVVHGGVDEQKTESSVGDRIADASVTETSTRATIAKETGVAKLTAKAGYGSVGASVGFQLTTNSDPYSGFRVAGAGGYAAAEFQETITIKLRPWIGDPTSVLGANLEELRHYTADLVVGYSADYQFSSTGSGQQHDLLLEFETQYGVNPALTSRVTDPGQFVKTGPTGRPSYGERFAFKGNITAEDVRDAIFYPVGSNFPSTSFDLRLLVQFSGSSIGDGSAIGMLDASHTMKVIGLVFRDSNGNVLPMSSLVTIESGSGTEYQILDSLPEGTRSAVTTAAVPEPSSITLAGFGLIGAAAAIRRRGRSRLAA